MGLHFNGTMPDGIADPEDEQLGKPTTETTRYPRPTADRPRLDELQDDMDDGGCEATDGCWVEPDGTCQHGHVSWLLYLGMI